MKRLLVCLLLVGVVGCGTSPSPKPPHVFTDVEKANIEYTKGNHFAKRKDWINAIACYNKSIQLGPTFFTAYNNRGYAYSFLEEYDKAIANYTEAIRIDPDDAKAYNARGAAYGKKGLDVKADADFAKAKALGFDP